MDSPRTTVVCIIRARIINMHTLVRARFMHDQINNTSYSSSNTTQRVQTAAVVTAYGRENRACI